MSYGVVVCSKCNREVHQNGPYVEKKGYGWRHCEDKTAMCADARPVYPQHVEQIQGKWCGVDGFGLDV